MPRREEKDEEAQALETHEEKLWVNITIWIEDQENNFWVHLPERPTKWRKDLELSCKEQGAISMSISTISTGCGGCAVGFFPCSEEFSNPVAGFDNGKGFGFILDKPTLRKVIRALQIAEAEMED